MLDDSVFARVIGDDDERAARSQAVTKGGKRSLQARELVVHGDAKRLEQAGELRGAAARTQHSADGANEVVARLEPFVGTTADDLVR